MKPNIDSLGRRSRTRPCSTDKRVRLQERDWRWLKAIHCHGPLASSFLLDFAKPLGTSLKRAQERLGDLFHEANTPHGGPYLTRPAQQFLTIDSRYNRLVYDLAPAGVKALKDAGVWQEHSGTKGGPWVHSLMVSSVTASIELATLGRTELTYIPQSAILMRANTSLVCPVSYADPAPKYTVTKSLLPDALFGLEYHTPKGSRFRFFAVEADRGTEPLTSKNQNRKSLMRNLRQYQAYIEGGVYQGHLGLTAPLLVLNVMSNPIRTQKTVAHIERTVSGGMNYQLFQSWDAFAAPFRPPAPNYDLLFGAWQRAGHPAISIDR